jgi:hypothetical protein
MRPAEQFLDIITQHTRTATDEEVRSRFAAANHQEYIIHNSEVQTSLFEIRYTRASPKYVISRDFYEKT